MHNFIRVYFGALAVFLFMQSQQHSSGDSIPDWNRLFNSNRSIILTGPWEQAESAWGELQRDSRTQRHLETWIKLQVEILIKTDRDPLKSELRQAAIQQMLFNVEESRPYLGWLKSCVEKGSFKELAVHNKAKELLLEMEEVSK